MTDATAPLNDAAYREQVTGAPEGISYRVEDPTTGLVFHFDAYLDGRLVYVIADRAHHYDTIDEPSPSPDDAFVDIARLQVAVCRGYPIAWCVQRRDDADRLTVVLRDAGVTGIDVTHVPARPELSESAELGTGEPEADPDPEADAQRERARNARPYVKIRKVAETEEDVTYRYGFPEPEHAMTIGKSTWQQRREEGAPAGMASIVLRWLTWKMVLQKLPEWPDEARIQL